MHSLGCFQKAGCFASCQCRRNIKSLGFMKHLAAISQLLGFPGQLYGQVWFAAFSLGDTISLIREESSVWLNWIIPAWRRLCFLLLILIARFSPKKPLLQHDNLLSGCPIYNVFYPWQLDSAVQQGLNCVFPAQHSKRTSLQRTSLQNSLEDSRGWACLSCRSKVWGVMGALFCQWRKASHIHMKQGEFNLL